MSNVKCPYCKEEIDGLNIFREAHETFTCGINAGEYEEDEQTYEPVETVYSCPECGRNFDFTHSEDAKKFLKGGKI